jgi:hypothetical protein
MLVEAVAGAIRVDQPVQVVQVAVRLGVLE